MGGGPWVVTMQFHLQKEGGRRSSSGQDGKGLAKSSRTRYRGKPPKSQATTKLIRNPNELKHFQSMTKSHGQVGNLSPFN